MPKPITSEMLHTMTLAKRKTLHQNALGRDTPAAYAVLDLLSRDNLMSAQAPAKPGVQGAAGPHISALAVTRKPVRAITVSSADIPVGVDMTLIDTEHKLQRVQRAIAAQKSFMFGVQDPTTGHWRRSTS